jgi:hypothetical protein
MRALYSNFWISLRILALGNVLLNVNKTFSSQHFSFSFVCVFFIQYGLLSANAYRICLILFFESHQVSFLLSARIIHLLIVSHIFQQKANLPLLEYSAHPLTILLLLLRTVAEYYYLRSICLLCHPVRRNFAHFCS